MREGGREELMMEEDSEGLDEGERSQGKWRGGKKTKQDDYRKG